MGHLLAPFLSLDAEIRETDHKVNKQNVPVLSNGKYELVMIPLAGWNNKINTVYPEGTHLLVEKCALST